MDETQKWSRRACVQGVEILVEDRNPPRPLTPKKIERESRTRSGLAITSALIARSLKCPLSFGFNDGEVNVDKVHAMAFRVLTHCTLVGSVIAIDYGPTFRQRTVR